MSSMNREPDQRLNWPEPQEITVRCPFCGGAVMVPFEVNGWVPSIEGKISVTLGQPLVNHNCPNV